MKDFYKAKRKFALKRLIFIDTDNKDIYGFSIMYYNSYYGLLYNKLTDKNINKQFTIYHEVGHCYLNHLDTTSCNLFIAKFLLYLYFYLITFFLFSFLENLFILSFIYITYKTKKLLHNHKIELEADKFASKYSKKKNIKKQILWFIENNHLDSFSHPSSYKRIINLVE